MRLRNDGQVVADGFINTIDYWDVIYLGRNSYAIRSYSEGKY